MDPIQSELFRLEIIPSAPSLSGKSNYFQHVFHQDSQVSEHCKTSPQSAQDNEALGEQAKGAAAVTTV